MDRLLMKRLPFISHQLLRVSMVKNRLSAHYVKVVIVGSGSNSSARSALVVTNKTNYGINCSENTAKIIRGMRLNVGRLENVYITHNNWRNYSGILGLYFSLRESSATSLTIHGPLDAFTTLKFSRPMLDTKCDLDLFACEKSVTEDENFTIEMVSFSPSENRESENKWRNMSYAYHFKPHPVKRKIDMDKCHQLNLPRSVLKSSKMSAFANDEDVTLDDGRVILAKDVTMEGKPISPFMFLESASDIHINCMLNSEHLKSLLNSSPPSLVVHFTDTEVQRLPSHAKLLAMFPDHCQHLFVDGREQPHPYVTLSAWQGILHMMCNRRVYPMLPFQQGQLSSDPKDPLPRISDKEWMELNAAVVDMADRLGQDASGAKRSAIALTTDKDFEALRYMTTNEAANHPNAYSAIPMLNYSVFPQSGFSTEYVMEQSFFKCMAFYIFRNPSSTLQTLYDISNNALERITKDIKDGKLATQFSKYPRVVVLGTASSVPSLCRSTSGYLLRCSDDTSVLLDCGEGTLAQIYLFYGEEEAKKLLRTIRLICVSHQHADHCGGLMSIISARDKACKEVGNTQPVHLLGHATLKATLNFFAKTFGSDSVPTNVFHQINTSKGDIKSLNGKTSFSDVCKQIGFEKIDAVHVKHIYHAHGFVLRHKSGWSIVFSGDTRPSENLVKAGKDCDLLIHEGTFDQDEINDAIYKKHSTFREAIDVGNRMGAKFILLTHFSQRYCQTIWHTDVPENVAFATDMMQVSLEDLPYLKYFKDLYTTVFMDRKFGERSEEKRRKAKPDRKETIRKKAKMGQE